jgi:hypothetical protein
MKSDFDKRNFRRLCARYVINDNGMLFKDGKRVLNECELEKVLKSIHNQPHGGHLGINKT